MKKKGIKINNNYQDMMADAFENVECVMNQKAGGNDYKNSLMEILENLDSIGENNMNAQLGGSLKQRTS